jgi:predicted outer membrane repeat protein
LKRRLSIAPLLLLIVPFVAAAATIRVDAGGGGDHTTLAGALGAACPGDTILVAPGTYTGPGNRDIDLPHGDLSILSEAGAAATVIDCQSAARALAIRKHGTTLRGFTFTGGSAEEGGAIWIGASSPTIADCRFVGNAAEKGGAFYCVPMSRPDIDYCQFVGNSATTYGGGIYFSNSRPTMYECTFEGNSAGVNGGAITMKQGTTGWLIDCVFTGNDAQDGGAIYIGTLSTWWWEDDFTTTIGFSSFSENQAVRGGAVFINARCLVELIWCTFTGNQATWGGGLYGVTNDPGRVFVQNCTLCENAAQYGGGICTCGWFWDPEWSEFRISRSIIAFSEEGSAICRLEDSYAFSDYSIAYGNAAGDVLYGGDLNLYGDPLFCDMYSGNFDLCENSMARPPNNPWGVLMGSSSDYCGPCDSPALVTSWGRIKAKYR